MPRLRSRKAAKNSSHVSTGATGFVQVPVGGTPEKEKTGGARYERR